jgi:DNA-binding winged helix-turn-helix (wHTH) protein/Flp pilus assembly protein TadD
MGVRVPPKPVYRFLGYNLDPVRRVIARDGELLPMPPKVVDTLIVLVEHAGKVVDKDTLMHSVWPDTAVVESSLTRNISLLRKALAQDGNGETIIQTVSRRGYRFLPPVETADENDERIRLPGARLDPAVAGTAAGATPPLRRALALASAALVIAAIVGAFLTAGPLSTPDRGEVLTEAEREYVLGRHSLNKIEPAHVERALKRFQKAAELNPDSALAHAGIADSHVLMIQLATPRANSLSEARWAARRAIALDPNLAPPRVSLGYVAAMSGLDLASARREFERAAEIGVPAALPGYGDYLTWIGDLEGARRYFTRAKQIDPVSPLIGTRAARLEYFARRYEHAIELLTDVLEREPSFSQARYYLALSHAFERRTDAALRELRRAQLNPDLLATDEAWIRALGGDTASAHALIAERRKAIDAGTRKWTVLLIPAISIGDRELAIQALEEMWTTREIELLHLKVDPRFDPLRSDVRFQNLMKRVFDGA